MKSIIVFATALMFNSILCIADTVDCTGKQECFPKESSTWHLFENEKIDKKLSVELNSAEKKFLKHIKSFKMRKLLRVQFKKAQELSGMECDIIYTISGAGAHWPGVHVAECKISYKNKHLASLRAAQACIRKGADENECIPLLFKISAWGGLEN